VNEAGHFLTFTLSNMRVFQGSNNSKTEPNNTLHDTINTRQLYVNNVSKWDTTNTSNLKEGSLPLNERLLKGRKLKTSWPINVFSNYAITL